MTQNAIEALLKQKLGLDANSIGSRRISHVVAQRQAACQLNDRAAYLQFLQSSSQELNCLIEAIVVPETWFFRDKEPFIYLQSCLREWRSNSAGLLRILSIPCSTGEEPYSIAMTLLGAGFTSQQFQIDAVDVSQQALAKARQAVYGKKSFRGVEEIVIQRYFQPVKDGYEVRSIAREAVHFIWGNVLEPRFLGGKKYQVIFCRNLLIYLDQASRDRVMRSLDAALVDKGLLFLGAAETSQLRGQPYTAIDHPFAFAYRKEPPVQSPQATKRMEIAPAKMASPPQTAQPIVSSSKTPSLETAKQLADCGQLRQAADLCEAYLRANPMQASAHLLLGEICQGLDQPKQAEQHFQKSIYLDPNAYEALIHLALLKEQQGDRVGSQRLKQRAQRLVNYRSKLN